MRIWPSTPAISAIAKCLHLCTLTSFVYDLLMHDPISQNKQQHNFVNLKDYQAKSSLQSDSPVRSMICGKSVPTSHGWWELLDRSLGRLGWPATLDVELVDSTAESLVSDPFRAKVCWRTRKCAIVCARWNSADSAAAATIASLENLPRWTRLAIRHQYLREPHCSSFCQLLGS